MPLLDIASYARRGPGQRDHLTSAEIELVTRTVRRTPEVMVKVTGGGASAKAVGAHFKYIDRGGAIEIETDEGEKLTGKGVESQLIEDWDLEGDELESKSVYNGRPGRKPAKLVHNIILSMPKGTPAEKVLAASRNFAREEFALQYRYALVLHTDQPHPHVHLVVKAMSEEGERFNIRKATLRRWRSEFAWNLRALGVEANATERAVRGQIRPAHKSAIFRAGQRGASTYLRAKAETVAAELLRGHSRSESGRHRLVQTRRDVEQGWKSMATLLNASGRTDLASEAQAFVERMPPPQTEREMVRHELSRLARDRAQLERAAVPGR